MIQAVAAASCTPFLEVFWNWPLALVNQVYHCVLFNEGVPVKRTWRPRRSDRVNVAAIFKLKG
jgi:hypothetical protein